MEFQRRFSPHPTPPLTLQPTPTCRLTGLLLVFQANPISITTKENRASPSLSPIPKTNTSRHSLRENEFDRPRFNCALSEDDFRSFFLSFFPGPALIATATEYAFLHPTLWVDSPLVSPRFRTIRRFETVLLRSVHALHALQLPCSATPDPTRFL